MQLGMIGLGRMGANLVRRLMRAGHECVVYDLNVDAVTELAGEGAVGATELDKFVAALTAPRAVWIMIPAAFVESTIDETAAAARARRHSSSMVATVSSRTTSFAPERLGETGIVYLDVGTSGGVYGLERGYCLMIGGRPRPR